MDTSQLIELGQCNKVHGLKGEFLFFLYNQNESQIQNDKKVFIEKDGEFKEFIVSQIRFGNKAIALLEGISDRNQAEQLLPFKIYMHRLDFEDLDNDQYYLGDLIGIDVYVKDKQVGKVLDYYDNSAQEVLIILFNNGSKTELPLVDTFFPLIDIENNRIEMITPEFDS